jgi:hypothetical protein
MRRIAGRALIWVVSMSMFFSGKKIHCVNTQGFGLRFPRTIDRDQFGPSVFRQAQQKLSDINF